MRYFLTYSGEVFDSEEVLYRHTNVYARRIKNTNRKFTSDDCLLDWAVEHGAKELKDYDGCSPIPPRYVKTSKVCPYYPDCIHKNDCMSAANFFELTDSGPELYEEKPSCFKSIPIMYVSNL